MNRFSVLHVSRDVCSLCVMCSVQVYALKSALTEIVPFNAKTALLFSTGIEFILLWICCFTSWDRCSIAHWRRNDKQQQSKAWSGLDFSMAKHTYFCIPFVSLHSFLIFALFRRPYCYISTDAYQNHKMNTIAEFSKPEKKLSQNSGYSFQMEFYQFPIEIDQHRPVEMDPIFKFQNRSLVYQYEQSMHLCNHWFDLLVQSVNVWDLQFIALIQVKNTHICHLIHSFIATGALYSVLFASVKLICE